MTEVARKVAPPADQLADELEATRTIVEAGRVLLDAHGPGSLARALRHAYAYLGPALPASAGIRVPTDDEETT